MTFDGRAQRARILASRYPASRNILNFYSGLAEWQGQVHALKLEDLRPFFPSLLDLVIRTAPMTLADAARASEPNDFEQWIASRWNSPGEFSTGQFFARAILQPYAASLPAGFDCPWCAYPPQAGCLSPRAEGLAFEVSCSLCMRRRPFPRATCPGCNATGENQLSSYTAPDFPHLRLQACNSCKAYLQVVDLSKDLEAIPEVDELAGLPLDLWAQEQGYHKLQPNIAGI
jgi:FdhE protein